MNLSPSFSRISLRLLLAGLLAVLPGALLPARAGLFKPGEDAKPTTEKKSVSTMLTAEPDGQATESFTPDTAKIYLLWKGDAFKAGDKLRSVWIAEDVADAAPKNTKIDEATLTLEETKASGSMTLSKPTKGFPPGSYHVELYLNDELAATVKFTIAK